METMNYTIREAVPLDRPSLVHLMAALQDFERSLHPNRSDGRAIASGHLAYLEQTVKSCKGRILIAENFDGVLGFLVCFVETASEGDLHVVDAERRVGYISDLYVKQEGRSKGVGTALIYAAETHFKAMGLSKLRLTVLAQNQSARAMYESLGYKPYEVIYERSL